MTELSIRLMTTMSPRKHTQNEFSSEGSYLQWIMDMCLKKVQCYEVTLNLNEQLEFDEENVLP